MSLCINRGIINEEVSMMKNKRYINLLTHMHTYTQDFIGVKRHHDHSNSFLPFKSKFVFIFNFFSFYVLTQVHPPSVLPTPQLCPFPPPNHSSQGVRPPLGPQQSLLYQGEAGPSPSLFIKTEQGIPP